MVGSGIPALSLFLLMQGSMGMESRGSSIHGAVREMCGTGRAVGARRQSRTPICVCVSAAATGMGSATTSGRMKLCGESTCGRWAGPVEASSS